MAAIYGFFFLEAVVMSEDELLHGGVITRRTKKIRKKGQFQMNKYTVVRLNNLIKQHLEKQNNRGNPFFLYINYCYVSIILV